MPAIPLGERKTSPFEIIAVFGDIKSSISHVGLAAEECIVKAGKPVNILHMGPPLALNPPSPVVPGVVAWLPLSPEEEECMRVWLLDLATRQQICTYIALPSEEPVHDPVTNRVTAWRFSCAGFVNAAYREGASVQLLIDDHRLPELPFETIYAIWNNNHYSEPLFRRIMEKSGIKGEGPWKVLAPGFLVHALKTGRDNLPYSPRSSDVSFIEECSDSNSSAGST